MPCPDDEWRHLSDEQRQDRRDHRPVIDVAFLMSCRPSTTRSRSTSTWLPADPSHREVQQHWATRRCARGHGLHRRSGAGMEVVDTGLPIAYCRQATWPSVQPAGRTNRRGEPMPADVERCHPPSAGFRRPQPTAEILETASRSSTCSRRTSRWQSGPVRGAGWQDRVILNSFTGSYPSRRHLGVRGRRKRTREATTSIWR